MPEIMESLFGLKQQYLDNIQTISNRINNRNASVYWESERNRDIIHTFLERKRDIEEVESPELSAWLERFSKDASGAALDFWYEMHKGIRSALKAY